MRVVGDDMLNSFQGELVAKLNAELQKEAPGQQIEVHACAESLDENKSLADAHERARVIGGRLNAMLVIWGRKIGEKKFYPRITVVGAPERWGAVPQRTSDARSIPESPLPEVLVDEPFYLIHFAAGHTYFRQTKYKEALPHFEAVLRCKGGSDDELADLHSSTAFCKHSLALGQKGMGAKLLEAIQLYQKAAKVYERKTTQSKWAMTQNNLGNAYWNLPTGDRVANQKNAITAYEAALRVFTEKDFPVDWAMTQNNLGNAYWNFPTGDRVANLKKAITAYEAALRVYTEKDFPADWARTQNNLGNVHSGLPIGVPAENLQNAVTAYEAALRVYTEKDYPADWAAVQNNLGTLFADLKSGDRDANLQKAIVFHQAALRVRTEKDFPVDWATTQFNLGTVYGELPSGDRAASLQKAIAASEASLRVRTKRTFPSNGRRPSTTLAFCMVSCRMAIAPQTCKRPSPLSKLPCG